MNEPLTQEQDHEVPCSANTINMTTDNRSIHEHEDYFEDDPGHPIPHTGTIDSTLSLTNGKQWYGLAIAGPLRNDLRSRKRLIKKLETYLEDFHSPESVTQFGAPKKDFCRIYVGLPMESDPEIYSLLEESRPWIESNGVTLIIRTIAKYQPDESLPLSS